LAPHDVGLSRSREQIFRRRIQTTGQIRKDGNCECNVVHRVLYSQVHENGSKKKKSRIRPRIYLERARELNPPVAPGVIASSLTKPLAYIRSDAAAVQVEADMLRLSIGKGVVPTEGAEYAEKRLGMLEVTPVIAQVNLPEVR